MARNTYLLVFFFLHASCSLKVSEIETMELTLLLTLLATGLFQVGITPLAFWSTSRVVVRSRR